MVSDNGLEPMSQQAVIRSKDKLEYRQIYTSLDLSELNVNPRVPREWTYFCVYAHAHVIHGINFKKKYWFNTSLTD